MKRSGPGFLFSPYAARRRGLLLCFAVSAAAGSACAEQTAPVKSGPPPVTVQEQDLRRIPVPRGGIFPWEAQPGVRPAPAANPAAPEGLLDVSSGEVYIESRGPFSRLVQEVEETPGGKKFAKEILTLQVDLAKFPQSVVEIVQRLPPPAKGANVLRGQTIKLVRDIGTGNLETLEALGSVQIVSPPGPANPGRSARGEQLIFETRYGPKGELVKNTVTVRGDRETRRTARMWFEADSIEAYKFEIDLRLDTFHATGAINSALSMNARSAPAAPGKPAPGNAAGGSGLLPGLSLASQGVVGLGCDGELHYESAAGRVKASRNVTIKQEGLLMLSDEMTLLLQQSDQAVPAGEKSIFSGSMKSIECAGRVAIMTATQVIHCDRMVYDLVHETLRLETRKASDEVKIYFRDPAFPNEMRAVQVLTKKHRLDVDTKTETIVDIQDASEKSPANPMSIKPFQGLIPQLRTLKTSRP